MQNPNKEQCAAALFSADVSYLDSFQQGKYAECNEKYLFFCRIGCGMNLCSAAPSAPCICISNHLQCRAFCQNSWQVDVGNSPVSDWMANHPLSMQGLPCWWSCGVNPKSFGCQQCASQAYDCPGQEYIHWQQCQTLRSGRNENQDGEQQWGFLLLFTRFLPLAVNYSQIFSYDLQSVNPQYRQQNILPFCPLSCWQLSLSHFLSQFHLFSFNFISHALSASMEYGSRCDSTRYMRKGSHWHATIVESLVTHFREFNALCQLHTLPQQLINTILQPTPPPQSSLSLENTTLPNEITDALKGRYNSSQQEAIASAVSARGSFTLVQVRRKAHGTHD